MVLWVQRYNFFVIILQICRNLLNFAANKQEPLRKSCEMKALFRLSAITLGVILCMSFVSAPETPELSLKGLLKLMIHTEDFEEASTSGLDFLFEAGNQDGEIECIKYVYGRDVKKGKEEYFGYEVVPTSSHAIYFTYSLDTSRQASLYFASEDDAKQFIKQMLCQPPVKYDGKTFFVQPKDQENGQYIYVNRMFDGGDNFTTEFVIYPIQQENNFWRIEIEIYC